MVKSEDVQKLREITGAGVMECKKALEDASGDLERAKILIGEQGLLKAEKKADRQTGAGLLESYIHNGRVGVLLELRCETDFVAHADPVKQLAHDLAMHVASMDPQNVEELLSQPYFRDPAQTVEQVIKQVIARVGENLKVARFMRYQL